MFKRLLYLCCYRLYSTTDTAHSHLICVCCPYLAMMVWNVLNSLRYHMFQWKELLFLTMAWCCSWHGFASTCKHYLVPNWQAVDWCSCLKITAAPCLCTQPRFWAIVLSTLCWPVPNADACQAYMWINSKAVQHLLCYSKQRRCLTWQCNCCNPSQGHTPPTLMQEICAYSCRTSDVHTPCL